MLTRCFRFCSILALLFVTATANAVADEPILLRFSHVVGEKTPKGIGAELFKEKAEARLPGRVRVEVYPRSMKFRDEEVLLALLFGDIELAAPSFTLFRAYNPAMQVFELPFMFDSIDHLHRFEATPTGQALLASMENRGIKGLSYWDNGPRVMSAIRPLRSPADAKGLVFRIEPSAVFQKQYDRIGATAIPMPFAMLTDALRDGLIEGQENSWSNIRSRGVQDYQKDFLETNHSFLGYMVVTNAQFWNGLPPDVRVTLEQVMREVSVEVNRIALQDANTSRSTVAATPGVTVRAPTAEEREQWRDALTPVWDDFRQDIGANVIAAAVAAGREP